MRRLLRVAPILNTLLLLVLAYAAGTVSAHDAPGWRALLLVLAVANGIASVIGVLRWRGRALARRAIQRRRFNQTARTS